MVRVLHPVVSILSSLILIETHVNVPHVLGRSDVGVFEHASLTLLAIDPETKRADSSHDILHKSSGPDYHP